jgi:hypothetical protein
MCLIAEPGSWFKAVELSGIMGPDMPVTTEGRLFLSIGTSITAAKMGSGTAANAREMSADDVLPVLFILPRYTQL